MAVLQRHKYTLRCLTLCNIFVSCGTDGIASRLLRLSLYFRENCKLNALYLGKDFRDEHGTIVHCCGEDHLKYGLREHLIYYILDRHQNAGQFPFESVRPLIQDLVEQKIWSIGSCFLKQTAHNIVERVARLQQDDTFWIQMCDLPLQDIFFLPPIYCYGSVKYLTTYSAITRNGLAAAESSEETNEKTQQVIVDESLVGI